LVYLLAALSSSLVALGLARAASVVTSRLGNSVRESLEISPSASFNLLAVRSSGDEASAILAVSQLLSWMVGRAWRILGTVLHPMFWLLRKMRSKTEWLPAFLLVLFFGLLFMGAFVSEIADIGIAAGGLPVHHTRFVEYLGRLLLDSLMAFPRVAREPTLENFVVLPIAIGILGGVTVAVLACFIWPAVILLAIVLLPFGAEAALAAVFVEISVESVPPGSWMVHQFQVSGSDREGLLSLAHSATHDDPRVIGLLACWIRGGPAMHKVEKSHT
jgi:hypothetical protein